MSGHYYHGGQAGLRIGEFLLPPAESGAIASVDCLTDAPAELQARAAEVVRRDRVYVTTDQREAYLFAALHPSGDTRRGGDVYRVEPLGPTEPDPDYSGPASVVSCLRARIVGICRTGVARGPYRSLIEQESS